MDVLENDDRARDSNRSTWACDQRLLRGFDVIEEYKLSQRVGARTGKSNF